MIDRFSATWLAIRTDLNTEIERSQNALERRGTPIDQTEYLRGRIAVCRDLLALPKHTPDDE